MMVRTPIGTFHRNDARQPALGPSELINSPVSSGAIATEADTTRPNSENAQALCWPLKYWTIIPLTCGVEMPAPTPWTIRIAFIHIGSWTVAQISDATVNSATPARKTELRPRTSPVRPAATSTMPKASA